MRGDNPLRGRLNAWMLDRLDEVMDRAYGERKRQLFGGLDGPIVEIGAGAGANLRYFPPNAHVIAVEPNRLMHARLRRAARRQGVALDIRGLAGEALDLDDDSVATVVGTLVLCTVDDPARVLREIHRVLRPGGRYLFVEHVAAPEGTPLRVVQRAIRGPWRWVFEGCTLTRPTHRAILEAGFSSVEMDCFPLHSVLFPVRPHVYGTAVK